MNTKKMITTVVALTVAAGIFLALKTFFVMHDHGAEDSERVSYYCPMHPNYTATKPGTCPICNMSLVKRDDPSQPALARNAAANGAHQQTPDTLRVFTVKELTAMKPGEICLLHKCTKGKCMIAMTEEFARLGKCPHCGEDLGIVIRDELPRGRAPVTLSPQKKQLIGIKTAPAQKKEIKKTVRIAGQIASDPDLYQAQAEYLQAVQSLKKAGEGGVPEIKEQAAGLVESARIKLKRLGLNDELIQALEVAGKPDRSLLYAQENRPVWFYGSIYEYELPFVKVGNLVAAEVPSIPGKRFEGRVRAIDPLLDPATRTARIRTVLENPENLLRPGMYLNATIENDLGLMLAVPKEAVFSTGEKNLIFVDKGSGVIEPREVTLGPETGTDYAIQSGLGEGERVVTSGNFLIDSESQLKSALEGVGQDTGGHQHGG